MELFIGNLHIDTDAGEINSLLGSFATNIKCRFIQQQRHNGNLAFATVSGVDEELGRRIIANLNNNPHRGKKMIVREFLNRSGDNNRREHEHPDMWYGLEKRVGERRALILQETVS